jgi:hypothetical protein
MNARPLSEKQLLRSGHSAFLFWLAVVSPCLLAALIVLVERLSWK